MAVTFNSPNEYKGRVYPFYTEPVQRDCMGYELSSVAKGDVIPQGTPIRVVDSYVPADASAAEVAKAGKKVATIAKYAKIKSKVDNKNFIVECIGFLAVGDKVYKSGGTPSTVTLSTISAIDKATKKITFAANNTDLAAGDVILEGVSVTTGTGESAVTTTEPATVPNRIVARTETMTEKSKTVSATHNAVVIKNVVEYPSEYLDSASFDGYCCLKGCPLIMFINQ